MAQRQDQASESGRQERWAGLSRGLLVRALELVFALVLVAGFFAAFFGIYSVSFPDATSLGKAVRRPDGLPRPGSANVAYEGFSQAEPAKVSAWLSQVQRAVKDKPPGGIVWGDSHLGQKLDDRHAVQTFERSSATISFDAGSQMVVGESSLVVIRASEEAARRRRSGATLVLLDGELSGKLASSPDEEIFVEVAGARSSLHLQQRAGDATEFKAEATGDDSSTYTIYSGVAEVVAGGRTVQLRANQTVTVDSQGRISAPRALPVAPTPLGPAEGAVLTYRSIPPEVRFSWEPRQGAESYRFVLARDPELGEVVHATELTEPSFRHGNLREGRYYWQVTTRRGGAESPAGPVRTLEIRLDREPPPLRVEFPAQPVDARTLRLTGETEPGAEVYVGEARISAGADGSFEHELSLRPGANVVVVEAIDPAGNTAYRSGLVHAQLQIPEGRP